LYFSKVVTGVRRCGKSTLFDLYIDRLKTDGVTDEQIIVINLEDVDFSELLDYEYAAFVAQVRRGTAAGQPLETAVKNAIRHCLENGVMEEFLTTYGSEVENMIAMEFNLETAKQVWREEWLEEGMEIGLEKGRAESRRLAIQNMKRENLSEETIARIFNMTAEEVKQSLN
jgi:hypothetical protein